MAMGFSHFDYVNPDAPKGGTVRLAASTGFDTLNPILSKGNPAPGLGLMYDSLFEPALDELDNQCRIRPLSPTRCAIRSIMPGSSIGSTRARAGTTASQSPRTT